MKAIEIALQRLIDGDSTLPVVWDALLEIWAVDSLPDDLDAFYREKEVASCRLEEALEKTFFEAYNELLQAVATHETAPWQGEEGRLVLIVDGMSVREACLLKPLLEGQGYRVEDLYFSLSALPSDTEAFARRHFNMGQPTQIKQRQGIFVSPPNHPVPRYPPHSIHFVWLRYPDKGLHASILAPSEVFTKTSQYLLEILRNSARSAFLLTADHGYIYAEIADHAFSISRQLQADMRRFFGGSRHVKGPQEVPFAVREKTLAIGQTLLVRGRYLWPQRDKRYFHGGLSFIECLVPVIKVRTN